MLVVKMDAIKFMQTLPAESVDAIVTDPPYGLSKAPDMAEVLTHWLNGDDYKHRGGGFMGKGWDSFVPGPAVWQEALRVLKPGGYLLSFSSARTYDLMALAVRLAGFEIRDQLMWIYGSGFPKSLDVSKAIDAQDANQAQRARRLKFTAWLRSTGVTASQIDAATGSNMGNHYLTSASQPAIATPEHLAQIQKATGIEVPGWVQDLVGVRSVESDNMRARGTKQRGPARAGDGTVYGLGMSGTQAGDKATTPEADEWTGWGTALKPAHEPIVMARKPLNGTVAANVLAHGTGAINIDGCRTPADDSQLADKYASVQNCRRSNTIYGKDNRSLEGSTPNPDGRFPANVIHDGSDEASGGLGDKSKYFYCPKASQADRDLYLDGWPVIEPEQLTGRAEGSKGQGNPRASARGRRRNPHVTVKPIDLMRWLVRMVTPPGGLVVDPYAGSGSTLVAGVLEGYRVMGSDNDATAAAVAKTRMQGAMNDYKKT